ncbi:hypothetical protein [uncultured Methanobrevibacter sp.]|uniref:glycosyltransferase family 39 protein n=1 Tax=uncultured Methanobrevibacter sp. TaxID=253161 RepID=UPI00262A00C2|nr:hypothetical protein [uncultured Methanobrevibacter sp.]
MINLKNNENKIGTLLFAISIITLLYVSYIGFTKLGMWNDEIHSLGLIKLPFNEFSNIVILDVHPPLYYLIYKAFYKIGVLFGINPIIIGKFTSLLPFYLILGLSATKIRKNFGYLTAGIFAFCIVSMPQLMNFAVELRMYSWGLFFITASFIYVYEIMNNNSNLKNWAILTILTIASAYTHYFSAVASFVIYGLLLLYLIKNNRSELKKWIISAAIAVLSYLPWLFILKQQVSTVSGSYWIAPITINRIIGYISFIFSPANQVINGNEIASFSILGAILLIGCALLIIKNKKEFEDKYGIYGILIIICVPLIGIILSLLIRPIFHPRYMIPSLGCLWLGISILLSKNFDNKKLFIPILVVILIVGAISCVDFTQNQINDQNNDTNNMNMLHNTFGEGNIIIYDGFVPYFQMNSYYLPNDHNFLLTITQDKEFNNTAAQISDVLADPGIQSELSQGSKVYFMSYKNYDGEITLNHDTFNLKKLPIEFDKFKAYEVEIK